MGYTLVINPSSLVEYPRGHYGKVVVPRILMHTNCYGETYGCQLFQFGTIANVAHFQ